MRGISKSVLYRESPSPDALRAPTSPRKRGEVNGENERQSTIFRKSTTRFVLIDCSWS